MAIHRTQGRKANATIGKVQNNQGRSDVRIGVNEKRIVAQRQPERGDTGRGERVSWGGQRAVSGGAVRGRGTSP